MADYSISPEVAARIDKLERESRVLRRVSFVTTLALVAVTAIGAAAVSGTTTSKALAIVDSSGRARVKLDAQGLHIFDSKGRERLSAVVNTANQPAFRLADPTGLVRFRAYITPDNDPSLKFEDNHGKDRFWLDLNSMDFYDAGGHDRLFVGMGTGDIPFMRVYDHTGTERLVVGGAAAESPVLKIFDGSHTERGFFVMYSDGASGATFWDSAHTTTWSSP